MTRRLDLPEGFVFADGVCTGTPVEMAARLEAEPWRIDELRRRLVDGDVERWLVHGGWLALADRVRVVTKGASDVDALRRVLQGDAMLVSGPPAMSQDPRMAEDRPDLLERQRAALRMFTEADAQRMAAERAVQEQQRNQEQEKRDVAEAKSARARELWQRIGHLQEAARGLYATVGLSDPWPAVTPLPSTSGGEDDTELESNLKRAQAALTAIDDTTAALRQMSRREAASRLALAVLALGLFAFVGAAMLGWAGLMLLLPLAIGAAVVLFRLDHVVAWTGRLTRMNASVAALSTSTGRVPRWVVRPIAAGLAMTDTLAARFDDPYVQAGTRATATLYYGGGVVAATLVVGYIAVVVGAVILALCLAAFIIGKLLEG
jgi:hypothetical protein